MKPFLFVASIGLLATAISSPAAIISWGTVGSNIQVGDLITTGSPFSALNGGNDTGSGMLTIGDNVFTPGPLSGAVTGSVSAATGTFYSPVSGNANLDTILDSHTWITGANPDGRGRIDILGLTIGNTYELQILSVGDDRSCCATRTQFFDDGNGNISGALARGTGDWVVGTFVAGATTESVFVTGENDPGISGYVVRDLGVVPEPGGAALALLGAATFALRRRR